MRIDTGDYISLAEAARLLGVTRQRVGQLARSGRIPFITVAGLPIVRRSDVAAYSDMPKLTPGPKPKR